MILNIIISCKIGPRHWIICLWECYSIKSNFEDKNQCRLSSHIMYSLCRSNFVKKITIDVHVKHRTLFLHMGLHESWLSLVISLKAKVLLKQQSCHFSNQNRLQIRCTWHHECWITLSQHCHTEHWDERRCEEAWLCSDGCVNLLPDRKE